MDPFWLIIGLIVLIATVLFNIIKAKGGAKLVTRIGNSILLALFAGIMILSKAEEARINDLSVNNNILSGGFFKSIRYTGESGGYSLFHESNFMTGEEFAIPKSCCDIPVAAKFTGNVYLIYTGDIVLYKNMVTIDSKSYNLLDSVVEVLPDTTNIRIIAFILALITAAGLNIVIFIIVLVQIKKEKQTE